MTNKAKDDGETIAKVGEGVFIMNQTLGPWRLSENTPKYSPYIDFRYDDGQDTRRKRRVVILKAL